MVGRDIYLVLENTAYTYYLYTYSLCSIGPGILFHRFCPQQRTADTYYRSIANPCSSIARYFHYMSNGQMLHLYISYICSDLQGVGSGLKRMLYHCSNYLPPTRTAILILAYARSTRYSWVLNPMGVKHARFGQQYAVQLHGLPLTKQLSLANVHSC